MTAYDVLWKKIERGETGTLPIRQVSVRISEATGDITIGDGMVKRSFEPGTGQDEWMPETAPDLLRDFDMRLRQN